MKPIYKSLLIEAAILSISLSLQAQVTSGEDVTTQDVQAESLEGLKVVLISPNVSGSKDLIASGECVLDGANIEINLQNLAQGIHRVQVSAVFGTQTCVIYALNLTVPAGALATDEPQEFEDEVIVVSTIGGGAGSQITIDPTPTEGSTNPVTSGGVYTALAGKQPAGNYADGSIYQVGESGAEGSEVENVAKVCGHSVELSNTAVATGVKAVAEGASTNASGVASHAEGASTTASGDNSHAEGGNTTASGDNSHAEGGDTTASGENSHAEGTNTVASGDNSHAEGEGTVAVDNQHVCGKYNEEDMNGEYALIVGNGADDQNRSNAFAIDWNGNLVLFYEGLPVVLTPEGLAGLIAILPSNSN